MPLRSVDDYVRSLRDGRRVYFRGERVPDVTTHPVIAVAVEPRRRSTTRWPRTRATATCAWSSGGDGEYSRYYQIPRSAGRPAEAQRAHRAGDRRGRDAGRADQGDRHRRAVRAAARVVRASTRSTAPSTPAASRRSTSTAATTISRWPSPRPTSRAIDRSAPSAQADPDLYVRIVERRPDGIVVRGAKAHTSVSTNANELIVLPTRAMGEADRDYAVSFADPDRHAGPGAAGLGLRLRRRRRGSPVEHPISARHKMMETTTVFDDVFVPWERVFLAGESRVRRAAGARVRRASPLHGDLLQAAAGRRAGRRRPC